MNTLKTTKNLTLQSLIPSLLVIAGLASINSSAQAACFGYPESTAGCTVNGTAGACVGKLAAGDTIVAGIPYGCTNPAGSPFAGESTCVIRGLGGNDLITASSNSSNRSIICSGGGNDVIQGGSDNDIILGEAGADIIIGAGGTNLLFGGSENDTMLLGDNNGYGSSNINYGGTGTRDICQAGRSGINVIPECEVKLP